MHRDIKRELEREKEKQERRARKAHEMNDFLSKYDDACSRDDFYVDREAWRHDRKRYLDREAKSA